MNKLLKLIHPLLLLPLLSISTFATIKDGSNFVTRKAPALGNNKGGGIEIVTTRTIGQHTLQRMGERGITESMVDKALQKGKRFWNPQKKIRQSIMC